MLKLTLWVPHRLQAFVTCYIFEESVNKTNDIIGHIEVIHKHVVPRESIVFINP